MSITPLARNEFICWVEDAKQRMTRERRIRRTKEELEEGQRRPCCWPGCNHRERTGKERARDARDRHDPNVAAAHTGTTRQGDAGPPAPRNAAARSLRRWHYDGNPQSEGILPSLPT